MFNRLLKVQNTVTELLLQGQNAGHGHGIPLFRLIKKDIMGLIKGSTSL